MTFTVEGGDGHELQANCQWSLSCWASLYKGLTAGQSVRPEKLSDVIAYWASTLWETELQAGSAVLLWEET